MRALEGIRVLDLSHVLAAPTATMFLADLGAEVLHVEHPRGDDAREYGPFVGEPDRDRSGYFISLNRNKKSMVLDLKQEEGREILRALMAVSDILVENFRPGTMSRLGFSWEEIQNVNPRIIYATISGFGHDALPGYASRPFYDMASQAYSGLMSITGPEGGPPCRVGSSIGDIIAGHHAVIGILAALMHRRTTGRGQHFDGSMIDSLFAVLENAVVRHTISGEIPEPLGCRHPTITPFQDFKTKDGAIVVAAGNDALWLKLCLAIGREDLAGDDRFRTNPLRTRYLRTLIPLLDEVLAAKTTAEWSTIFADAEIPYSPINSIKDICEDPHIRYRKMLVEIDQPAVGKIKIAGSPIHLSETPGGVYAPAPLLGQHSEEILRNILHFSPEKIDRLRREGVINPDVAAHLP